jgi:hypothetical protein
LLWYHAVPAGLGSAHLVIPVLFAGSIATTVFALCLIPALWFRPHPFLATLIGYCVAFVLALNLIADPILSAVGLGGLRWQIAYIAGDRQQFVTLLVVHVVGAAAFIFLMRSSRLKMWFSSLTRPHATAQLREALASLDRSPYSARLVCLVGILYERAGMRWKARTQLERMKTEFPYSPYHHFLQAIVAYSRRDYKSAQKSFVFTSDYPYIIGELKAGLLAAAACSAFANNDLTGALNLCERALEFDDACVVARMVKVDVFLRTGKKEQAGEELLTAMHMGLNLELEDKIPVDLERAYNLLVALEESKARRHILQSTNKFSS